jgi:hypothetical protein
VFWGVLHRGPIILWTAVRVLRGGWLKVSRASDTCCKMKFLRSERIRRIGQWRGCGLRCQVLADRSIIVYFVFANNGLPAAARTKFTGADNIGLTVGRLIIEAPRCTVSFSLAPSLWSSTCNLSLSLSLPRSVALSVNRCLSVSVSVSRFLAPYTS